MLKRQKTDMGGEVPLGRQVKIKHDIGGVRLDCSSEIVQKNWLR